MSSASQCIPWLVVLIIECLAIVILNIVTIVVFVKKKRQLQRRSTYLIIHLAIVDLLVGAVSGPLQIEIRMATFCNLWTCNGEPRLSLFLKLAFANLFSFTSLTNLVAISLERLHATFFPFRHRFMEKWVYRVIIIVIWLTAVARGAAQIVLYGILDSDERFVNNTLYIPIYSISLFVICVSYIFIFIKVRFSRHPQFHLAAKRERKMTSTTLIFSFASMLCFLPSLVYAILFSAAQLITIPHVIVMPVLMLFLANAVINPLVYALRMPGFRAGTVQIAPVDLPLRNLRTHLIN